MSNRIYDASQLTKRRAELAVAASFYSRSIQQAPRLNIKESSILNAVRTGAMTEFTRRDQCIAVSPGCPCEISDASVYAGTFPGAVTGVRYTLGSIIVSWNAAEGAISYRVTPSLHGVPQSPVMTRGLSYRFTNLSDWQPYTFTVCAVNDVGQGPMTAAPSILAPPSGLTAILLGHEGHGGNATAALQYVIHSALCLLLQYIQAVNLGPTRGARLFYLWSTTLVGAWNWVSQDGRMTGTLDQWNWSDGSTAPLSAVDAIAWMCAVVDHVTPLLIPLPYTSLFVYDAAYVAGVRQSGEWDRWLPLWNAWMAQRALDGSVAATSTQPTGSANWEQTIVVDGQTVTAIGSFPQPQQWTRLTVGGKKQNYLTHSWGNVVSTCLSEQDEVAIDASVVPLTGAARDAEIDSVKTLAANLSDAEKIQAEFWAGGPGEVAPPLICVWFWKEYMRCLPGVSRTTIMYSLQDLAVHLFEGSRVTWRLKALHMEARPIQEIRRRYAGQSILSWNGMIDGAQWIPYQMANFVTPPFADFPSGHSHFSKAFSLTMTKWFGETITPVPMIYDNQPLISRLFPVNNTAPYGTFIVSPGTSAIQPSVPSAPVTLSFETWEEVATSAGISRLYGGIHALSAHQASQTAAVEVDRVIRDTWNILTDATFSMAPAFEPVEPASAPVVPVAPASEPASEPVAPVEEPVVPVEVPVVPVEVPVEEPAAPVEEPVVPAAPVAPVEEPAAPVEEPVVPVEEPTAPIDVPVEPVVPAAPVDVPVVPVEEPIAPVVPVVPVEPVVPVVPVVPYKIQVNYITQTPSLEVQALITESVNWIERLMLRSHGLRSSSVSLQADMVVDLDIQSLEEGVLAGAYPTIWNTATLSGMPAMPLRQTVILNSTALHTGSLLSSCTLNGLTVVKLIPVMIHEMLHGLGIASIPNTSDRVGWGSFLDVSKTWYIGHRGESATSKAIQAYQAAIGRPVTRIPVENSFGQGTAYSHWEEGLKDGFVTETRTHNDGSGLISYPALPNEIMTGVAGTTFYLTPLTAGALLDYGYPVNETSSAIVPYPAL